jgi:hypothetical protein
MLADLWKNETGRIIVSVVLGLGLAALFKKACKNGGCVVIKGPKQDEVNNVYYKVKDECWTYTPYVVPCDEDDEEEPVNVE